MAFDFPGGAGAGKITVPAYTKINDLTTLTLVMWLQRTGVGGGELGRLSHKDGSWDIYWDDTDNTIFFNATRWSTTNGFWKNAEPTDNVWHHWAITYDYGDVNNDPVFFKDGVNSGSTDVTTPVGTLDSETGAITLGNHTTAARIFDGYQCEYALYNRILADSEIASLGADAYSPKCIPNGRVMYVPGIRGLQNLDGTVAAETATVDRIAHPRIIYPSRQQIFVPTAAAAVVSAQHLINRASGRDLDGLGKARIG